MIRKIKYYWQRIVAFGSIAALLIGGAAYLNYRHLELQAARIPSDIRRDLTFSPFIVTLDNSDFKATDYKLSDVEDNTQLLSFIVSFDSKRVTVSEYTQPPQFTEIPEFKQRFLDNVIQQNGTVQTSNGTLYLGKQAKQDGKQIGIMLERGLIVMFNPSSDLTEAEWRRLGEQFDIQKISS